MRLAEIPVNFLLVKVREDGEKADEVGLPVSAGNGGSVGMFEAPVRAFAKVAGIFEQARHHIATDVADPGKWRELTRQSSAAASDINDKMVIVESA